MDTAKVQTSLIAGAVEGGVLPEVERLLTRARPSAIGVAAAAVTVPGVNLLLGLMDRCQTSACRVVAGIDYALTHPQALSLALDARCDVRLGHSRDGVFHAKLMVGGDRFGADGRLVSPSFCCVGSANLTAAGLTRNVECAYVSVQPQVAAQAAGVFGTFWRSAIVLTPDILESYSKEFAKRNRTRTPEAIHDLGISDVEPDSSTNGTIRSREPPSHGALPHEVATVAWAGLQSFTGEYAFQVEFPRQSGEVLRRMMGARLSRENRVDLICADGKARSVAFRFYEDNAMFRLNVPNDVPNVEWARANKDGAAVVRLEPDEGKLMLDILLPGQELDAVTRRSIMLGTWGKTSTRLYGWF